MSEYGETTLGCRETLNYLSCTISKNISSILSPLGMVLALRKVEFWCVCDWILPALLFYSKIHPDLFQIAFEKMPLVSLDQMWCCPLISGRICLPEWWSISRGVLHCCLVCSADEYSKSVLLLHTYPLWVTFSLEIMKEQRTFHAIDFLLWIEIFSNWFGRKFPNPLHDYSNDHLCMLLISRFEITTSLDDLWVIWL